MQVPDWLIPIVVCGQRPGRPRNYQSCSCPLCGSLSIYPSCYKSMYRSTYLFIFTSISPHRRPVGPVMAFLSKATIYFAIKSVQSDALLTSHTSHYLRHIPSHYLRQTTYVTLLTSHYLRHTTYVTLLTSHYLRHITYVRIAFNAQQQL